MALAAVLADHYWQKRRKEKEKAPPLQTKKQPKYNWRNDVNKYFQKAKTFF